MTHSSQLDQTKRTSDHAGMSLRPLGPHLRDQADEYGKVADRLFGVDSPFRVILFTSVSAGEGVSHVVQSISEKLVGRGAHFIAVNGSLSQTVLPGVARGRGERELRVSRSAVAADDHDPAVILLQTLRASYDYVLIDCGPLESSLDVTRLCAHADGVVLVVEANRTESAQLARAVQAIQESGGKLTGFVLNRYKDPLPRWLRRAFSGKV